MTSLPYLAVLSARFRMALQYRAAAAAGFATQAFWGYILCMIYAAYFHSTTHRQPLTLDQTITYVWLGQAMFALMPWSIDNDIRLMIRNGTVAYEMLRPVDLYGFWFARALAVRVAPTLLRAVPMFVVAGLFLGLKPPPSAACLLVWTLATVGAALLSSAIATLLTISLLWTLAGDGIVRIVPSAILIFSGMIVPLVFFPSWLQPLITALPFRDLVDVPFRIYMGQLPPDQWPALFAQEIVWILVLVAAGRVALTSGMRRLVVQGG